MAATQELDFFRDWLQQWVASLLQAYIQRLQAGFGVPSEPKEFNDPLWGTVLLEPMEVVILDSPLLQRLRGIRQLGVVHLVYYGANHTRLDHSVGAVHQIQALMDSINRGCGNTPLIKAEDARCLRLAAICHDVGHGVMSHVSQNAFESTVEVEHIRLQFSDELEIEERPLSEIAAYYIITSPEFRQLLEVAHQVTKTEKLPTDYKDFIANAVVGKPVRDDSPLLHELISGPFDADKLDYMPRDAQMCGVPVVTDVARLIQKVRAERVPESALPEDIAATVRGGLPGYVMIGLAMSGGRTLDELLLGRVMLRDKLYRHQKVRAAEAMVGAILRHLGSAVGNERAIKMSLEVSDSWLLEMRAEDLIEKAEELDAEAHSKELRVAVDMAIRLRERRLLRRAFAFAQNMPLDPYRTDARQWRGLEMFIRSTRNRELRESIRQSIVAETAAIIAALKAESVLKDLPDNDCEPYIWIDPPEPPEQEAGSVSHAFLLTGGKPLRFRDEAAETSGWSSAYLLTRDIGYVFSPEELAPYVYLASEKVARIQFGVRIPTTMLSYARQRAEDVDRRRRGLAHVNFYAGAPADLKPTPRRIEKADVNQRVNQMLRECQGYLGPSMQRQRGLKQGKLLNPERAVAWLTQFEEGRLIGAALEVLANIQFIGREEVSASLKAFVQGNEEFRGASATALGGNKDSSTICLYYSQDVAPELGVRLVDSLEEALGRQTPILFLDDFIGSGSQAIGIVESLLGVEPTVDLREERDLRLSDQSIEALLARKVSFVFAAGTDTGVDRLTKRLKQLGFEEPKVSAAQQALKSIHMPGVIADAAQRRDFIEGCTAVGEELLLDPGNGHDKDWTAARALGYGNDGFLAVFPYNTPAQTVTCLWATGKVGGVEWLPLFPRRKKV